MICRLSSRAGLCIGGLLLASFLACSLPPVVEQRIVQEPLDPPIIGVQVHIHGRAVLRNLLIVVHSDDRPLEYVVEAPPAAESAARSAAAGPPAGGSWVLREHAGRGPIIRCELASDQPSGQARLTFSADVALPALTVYSGVQAPFQPMRRSSGLQAMACTASGPSAVPCDMLFNTPDDIAVMIDRPWTCRRNALRMHIAARPGMQRAEISLTSVRNLLRTTFGLRAEQMSVLNPVPGAAPAGWTDVLTDEKSRHQAAARNATWLSVNLADLGADQVWCKATTRPADNASAAGSIRFLPLPGRAVGADFKQRVEKIQGIVGRIRERGTNYNWQHAKELLASTLEDSWAHGLLQTGHPGPLVLAAPLTLEHAKMYVSLLGLTGQAVMLGDDLTALPAERLDLIRRLLPVTPIDSVDLFSRGLPDRWLLSLADEQPAVSNGWERPWTSGWVVGLFNWTQEPRLDQLVLEELIPDFALCSAESAGGPLRPVAVWDLWANRLVAVTRDSVAVPVAPTSCRLLSIRPLAKAYPSILSAGRQVIAPGRELRAVQWDEADLSFAGPASLRADEPYELRFLVPEGPQSFEIAEVSAGTESVVTRRQGPVRVVTLQSDAPRSIQWSVRFVQSAQPIQPPSAPHNLRTEQNTRGVLLEWYGLEAATSYRIYRDDELLAETHLPAWQDRHCRYGRQYTYSVASVDWAGRESARSSRLSHQTPQPASTNLTELVPLVAEQEHAGLAADVSVDGRPLRVAGRRYHRGIGTHTNSRLKYFLGGGYERFTGAVGIDDETQGKGSAVFRILADGETLFTSDLLLGGQPARPFSVSVRGKIHLELIASDGGDGCDYDHADWGNPYLQAATLSSPTTSRPSR
jgi:hypothetical protein